MAHDFDSGPVQEPFASLVRDYPGTDVYSADGFRVEWARSFTAADWTAARACS
jgi:hypothetical protein